MLKNFPPKYYIIFTDDPEKEVHRNRIIAGLRVALTLLMEEYDVQSSVLVKINEKFYRPAEVELLLGDSSMARQELDWKPEISFDELVSKMVKFDIDNFEN